MTGASAASIACHCDTAASASLALFAPSRDRVSRGATITCARTFCVHPWEHEGADVSAPSFVFVVYYRTRIASRTSAGGFAPPWIAGQTRNDSLLQLLGQLLQDRRILQRR